eukprot:gene2679-34120_t
MNDVFAGNSFFMDIRAGEDSADPSDCSYEVEVAMASSNGKAPPPGVQVRLDIASQTPTKNAGLHAVLNSHTHAVSDANGIAVIDVDDAFGRWEYQATTGAGSGNRKLLLDLSKWFHFSLMTGDAQARAVSL